MKKAGIFFCFCLLSVITFSQTLSRQVFSSIGGFISTDQVSISHTVGQPEYTTTNSNVTILTQGFEQPDAIKRLMFETIIPSCDHGQGISLLIDVLEVCGTNEAEVFLNEQPVNTLIENVQEGTYEIEVVCGENNSFFLDIAVAPLDLPECEIEFYNAFAPNGTDDNQVWYIENIDLEDYAENSVVIFDRWGNTVWEGENYDNTSVVWKGTNKNGEDLTQGTYYYIVEVAMGTFKGYIELIK